VLRLRNILINEGQCVYVCEFACLFVSMYNNSIMGVLGDVISVGPNGPVVGASLKRWLEDVITVDPGPSHLRGI
jgi:hypothetical protein